MNMELYAMIIERGKTYNKITGEMVKRHVEFIRGLDDDGKLELCGAMKGCPGVAGMIILRAGSLEEAKAICKAEPFVAGGYATFRLGSFHVGNRDNNYLL